jgi:anti-sigma B factor antagonist
MLVIRLDQAEWDVSGKARLHELLAPAVMEAHVVVDMTDVTYMDSSSLSVLVGLYRERVVVKGFLAEQIVAPTPGVRRLFEITGFDRIWHLHDTLDEAVAAAESQKS